MKLIALIPARGGSKGILNKNLQEIHGKSLVQISIETANQVSYFSEVFVSSDSDEILSLSNGLGATALKRPKNLSSDSSRAEDVVKHLLDQLNHHQEMVIVYLQPTTPFTTPEIVIACIELYLQKRIPVVCVKQVKDHPEKMLKLSDFGSLDSYTRDSKPTMNRQDLTPLFLPTGGVYVFSADDFLTAGTIPVLASLPYVVYGKETLDIDTPLDLEIARKLRSANEL
jgi:CMP-N-acetylneuraminic acid synthetase